MLPPILPWSWVPWGVIIFNWVEDLSASKLATLQSTWKLWDLETLPRAYWNIDYKLKEHNKNYILVPDET